MTREMCNDFMMHDVFVNVDQDRDLDGLINEWNGRLTKRVDEAMSPLEVRLLKYT